MKADKKKNNTHGRVTLPKTHTQRTGNNKDQKKHATSQKQTAAEHIQVGNGTEITLLCEMDAISDEYST